MLYLLLLVVSIILFFIFANKHARSSPRKISRDDLIETVKSFLENRDSAYNWDDFLTFPISEPKMNTFRLECRKIEWTTVDGKIRIRKLLDEFSL